MSKARPQYTMSLSVTSGGDTGWLSNKKNYDVNNFFTVSFGNIRPVLIRYFSAVIYQNQICTIPMLKIQLWQIMACLQGWF